VIAISSIGENHLPTFVFILIVPFAVNNIPFLALRVGHTVKHVDSGQYFPKYLSGSHAHQGNAVCLPVKFRKPLPSLRTFPPQVTESPPMAFLLDLNSIYSADCWQIHITTSLNNWEKSDRHNHIYRLRVQMIDATV
jgi:hypothetical protein